MSAETLATVAVCAVLAWCLYAFGKAVGAHRQRKLWQDHMDRCNRYISAVDDLDRWCGHTSPHARLIWRHLRAQGEGESYNAGTPIKDEACDVSGLREQLQRLDAVTIAKATGSMS